MSGVNVLSSAWWCVRVSVNSVSILSHILVCHTTTETNLKKVYWFAWLVSTAAVLQESMIIHVYPNQSKCQTLKKQITGILEYWLQLTSSLSSGQSWTESQICEGKTHFPVGLQIRYEPVTFGQAAIHRTDAEGKWCQFLTMTLNVLHVAFLMSCLNRCE